MVNISLYIALYLGAGILFLMLGMKIVKRSVNDCLAEFLLILLWPIVALGIFLDLINGILFAMKLKFKRKKKGFEQKGCAK